MTQVEEPARAQALKPALGRFMRAYVPAVGLYAFTCVFAAVAANRLPDWAMILAALLPIAPALWMLHAYRMLLRSLDEVQQRIQHEAILIAAGVMGLGAFAYGLLESWAGFPHFNSVWFLPALIAVWGVAQVWTMRRYQ